MRGAPPDFHLGLPPFIRYHIRRGWIRPKLRHILYLIPLARFLLWEFQNS